MIDTKPQAAQCTRCGQLVLACVVGGVKVAADLTPLDRGGLIEAIRTDREVYDALERDGKLHRLRPLTASATWHPGRPRLRAHGCGAGPQDVKLVTTPEKGPTRPSATSGGALDGNPPATVPGSQREPQRLPAVRATNRPFDRRPTFVTMCDNCGQPIYSHQRYVAAQTGRQWQWAYHDDPAQCDMTALTTLGGFGKNRDWDALHNMTPRDMGRPIENIPLPGFEE